MEKISSPQKKMIIINIKLTQSMAHQSYLVQKFLLKLKKKFDFQFQS